MLILNSEFRLPDFSGLPLSQGCFRYLYPNNGTNEGWWVFQKETSYLDVQTHCLPFFFPAHMVLGTYQDDQRRHGLSIPDGWTPTRPPDTLIAADNHPWSSSVCSKVSKDSGLNFNYLHHALGKVPYPFVSVTDNFLNISVNKEHRIWKNPTQKPPL